MNFSNLNGLVAWYPMTIGSGTTLKDYKGSSDGTISGAVWEKEKTSQYSLKFNGTSHYVTLANDANFDLASVTVSSWVKTTNANTGWIFVKKSTDQGGRNAYGISPGIYDSGKICVRISLAYNTFIDLRVAANFNDGKWHHFAFTYNGTNLFLYMDSILIGSDTGTAIYYASSGLPADIGRESLGSGSYSGYLDGTLNNVMVFNRALTANEIKALYKQTYIE
jgi:hypothetical protein